MFPDVSSFGDGISGPIAMASSNATAAATPGIAVLRNRDVVNNKKLENLRRRAGPAKCHEGAIARPFIVY